MAKTPPTPTKSEPVSSPLPVDLAVDIDNQTTWTKATARAAYEAYIANSNGLAWDGRPCPTWDDLNHAVRSHWCAAVTGVAPLCREDASAPIADGASPLEGELRVCRDQLALANAAVKERDQKLKALSVHGDMKATKLAAERTAMLDREVDLLRAQVAALEAELRAKS